MDVIERLKIEARRINTDIIREQKEQDWVITKIKNHLNRNQHLELSVEDIQDQISNNELIASFFAKDPSRQNISEKYFAQVVKNIEGVEHFSNLPSSTRWFLVDGVVAEVLSKPVGLKSLDYIFAYKNKRVVATQKYTKADGGAQDNQYNDLVAFLQNSFNMEDDVLAIVLADGEYYTKRRLDTLKSINTNDNVIVCSVFELEEVLNERVK